MWAKAPAPWEYIKLQFCRDIWHCTPTEFDRVPVQETLTALMLLNVEAEVRQARGRNKNAKKSK